MRKWVSAFCALLLFVPVSVGFSDAASAGRSKPSYGQSPRPFYRPAPAPRPAPPRTQPQRTVKPPAATGARDKKKETKPATPLVAPTVKGDTTGTGQRARTETSAASNPDKPRRAENPRGVTPATTQQAEQKKARAAPKVDAAGQKSAQTQSSDTKARDSKHTSLLEDKAYLNRHFGKHKSGLPEYKTAEEYLKGAQKFVSNPPKTLSSHTRKDGSTLLYDEPSNTFGIRDKDGAPVTMFRPTSGKGYYERQIKDDQ